VTGRPAFGELLHAAHRHLTSQPGLPPPGRGDVGEVSRSLLRVVILLSRYLQDTTTALSNQPASAPAPVDPWGRARGQAREALHNAAGFLLRPGTPRPAWPAAPSASPLARRLDEVATCLAAGRDLLHTHFTPGPDGGRAHNSPLALAITSERLHRALLTDLGALACQAARHSANVALTPARGGPSATGQRQALNAACQWLWAFAATIDDADRQHPVPAADRALLAAIPVNALPARPALTAETIAGLCDAVTATAERTRHLAWHTTRRPPGSPALTVTSLRYIAETATVTSHHCALLATTLTQRAAESPYRDAADCLESTAQAARHATRTWYQTAQALRQVTTDTRGQLTPAAAETAQLAWWTGRLTYTDPAWTLATGPDSPLRSPEELAPTPEDMPPVIAAVHHAAEALALLAETEHEQLHRAIHARRILVPTRTLTSDYNIPRPYAPALLEDTSALLTRYRDTTRASHQTAAAIGRASCTTNAPSRALATARDITHTTETASPAKDTSHARAPAREPPPQIPGPLQHTLASLGITDPALRARSRDLDHASQRLLIDAADHLPPAPQRPPATTLNNTAAAAGLLNHALASGQPQTIRLLRQHPQPQRNQPAPEPEPEPEP
jgi:hypothetical protein